MFGESDSESPRTGSPWDHLLSRSPSGSASPSDEDHLAKSAKVIPKLVPEVEKGNVEYKLRLLNPTPERFTRLVTQLKWRLLEGGGQAYYELGVADSGQLVGLSRAHLEQTVQTLEEMAGEIGASVIIVKEIEIPPALVEKSDERGRIADGAMRMQKKRFNEYLEPTTPGDSTSAPTTDCDEPELSTPEAEDATQEFGVSVPVEPFLHRAHPGRSSTQSSPVVRSVEDQYDSASGDESWVFTGELEIATVYKLRPQRRRTQAFITSSNRNIISRPPTSSVPLDVPVRNNSVGNRRVMKDKWNRRKRNGRMAKDRLPVVEAVENNNNASFLDTAASPATLDDPSLTLDDLAEAAALLTIDNKLVPSATPELYEPVMAECRAPSINATDSVIPQFDPAERQFIVEALVVRKMSLEEVFLDFGNI